MLLRLVRRARRRLIWNNLLAQGANAFCAALLAFILLLLLGTQVLDWHWAALFPAAALGWGFYRTWRSAPGDYAAAQVVDREMALDDNLSTALYFETAPRRGATEEDVRLWQYSRAESLCTGVDVKRAVPFRMPRAVYAVAALFLVASGLFALRYGLSRSLDLRPPLAALLGGTMTGGSDPADQTAARKKNTPHPPGAQDQAAVSLLDRDKAAELDPALQKALEEAQIPELDSSGLTTRADSKGNEEGDQIAGDEGDGDPDGAQGVGDNPDGKQGGQPKEGQQSASNPQQGPGADKSSLLQKFKDAMQNLMSKMKQQGGQQGEKSAQNNKQGKQQGQGKQQSGQGQKQQSGGQQAESQEGQSADQSESADSSQTKGGGQDKDQQANKQPGSGIGKNDGDKDIKLAEQMAAMGKLSEIIGKRSQNVTGEVMVEVRNTNQQLATRYENRKAAHGETGGEISRDEVPVALQGYVSQYFEQVRKAAPAPAAAKK